MLKAFEIGKFLIFRLCKLMTISVPFSFVPLLKNHSQNVLYYLL